MNDIEKLRLRSDLGLSSSSLSRLFKMTDEVDPDTVIPDIERSIDDVIDRLQNTLRLLESH